jgi:DNA-binding NtrC family response regulator
MGSGDALPLLGADGHVRPLEAMEAETIRFAIDRYRGRMTEVARRLRIGRSTLYRKLKELGYDTGSESTEMREQSGTVDVASE